MLGAAIGGLLVLAVWYLPGWALMGHLPLSFDQQVLFALGLHTGAACIITAFIAARRWRIHFHRRVHPLTAFTGILVLFGAAVGILPGVLLSDGVDYGTQVPTLYSQPAVVLALCAASLLIIRGVVTRAMAR